MKKYWGYCRTSTEQQTLSLDAQIKKIKLYAELHNLHLVDIVVEQASAKDLKREGLQSILSRLGNDIDGVICTKLDRLTRSVKDCGLMMDKYFSKYELVVVDDHIVTTSPSGRLMINLLCSIATWEREINNERTKTALQELREQGVSLGAPAYGLCRDGKTFVPVPEEFEVVKEIKSQRAIGMSFSAIARRLNEYGVKTKKGGQWFPMQVSRIAKRDYQALLA